MFESRNVETKLPKEPPVEPTEPVRQQMSVRDHLQALSEKFRDWFRDLIDLKEGADRASTMKAIKEGKRMRGSNAWMLVCSIMIASLGLDLNSGAVIIGAMLISPLMSPILGVGLAVATNDREALSIALMNFGIAIVIALITSTLYFYVTPLGQMTDQIQFRTAPTFLDGLIAIFGGLAGIISMTRADKGNALPGVAIATALMPPLCVTGFGLATGNMPVALNSFYLFFLNSFFIALTSYIIIRFLRFPRMARVNERDARRARLYTTLFSILIIIPSAFILQDVLQDLRYQRNVNAFVKQEFPKTCVDYKVFYLDEEKDSAFLVTQLIGQRLPDSADLVYYDSLLLYQYGVPNTSLRPISDNSLPLQQLEDLQYELTSLGGIREQVEAMEEVQRDQRETNEALQEELTFYHPDTADFRRFSKRVKAAFPDLDRISLGRMQATNFDSLRDSVAFVLVDWRQGLRRSERTKEEVRLRNFLEEDLRVDTIEVVRW